MLDKDFTMNYFNSFFS